MAMATGSVTVRAMDEKPCDTPAAVSAAAFGGEGGCCSGAHVGQAKVDHGGGTRLALPVLELNLPHGESGVDGPWRPRRAARLKGVAHDQHVLLARRVDQLLLPQVAQRVQCRVDLPGNLRRQ
jgi:hypothetical protein